jgi:hypothetical protein
MRFAMNQFEIGEKILYLGIYGNEFNLVDEVIGIEDDEYLNRKKYMIKNTESGEVISQYGTNYRKATKEEVAVGHRLESNNGQAIRVCNLNNYSRKSFTMDRQIKQSKNESLLEYLNRCEEQVKRWPKWKIESIRDAFGLNTIKGKQAGTI